MKMQMRACLEVSIQDDLLGDGRDITSLSIRFERNLIRHGPNKVDFKKTCESSHNPSSDSDSGCENPLERAEGATTESLEKAWPLETHACALANWDPIRPGVPQPEQVTSMPCRE